MAELRILTFRCPHCCLYFQTANDLANHRLDAHAHVPIDVCKFRLVCHRNGNSIGSTLRLQDLEDSTRGRESAPYEESTE